MLSAIALKGIIEGKFSAQKMDEPDNQYRDRTVFRNQIQNYKLIVVAAIGPRGEIALAEDGKPWIFSDESYLKEFDTDKPLILSRDLADSNKGLLEGRIKVILDEGSRAAGEQSREGTVVVNSIEDALDYCRQKKSPLPLVFGGKDVYERAMPFARALELTTLHQSIGGNAPFHYNRDDWVRLGDAMTRASKQSVLYTRQIYVRKEVAAAMKLW
jgi:dihydrofolate reductase